MPSVILIGTGRMAYHLGHAMVEANVPLVGIAGRNAEKLADLSRYLDLPALRWGAPLPEAHITSHRQSRRGCWGGRRQYVLVPLQP